MRILSTAIFLAALAAMLGVASANATLGVAPAKSRPQIQQTRPGADPCDMAVLNQQILLNPSNVNALLMRAYCDMNMTPGPNRKPPLGSLMQAMNDLETVLRMDPKNYYAVHDYAQVAYLLGYDDFAAEEYTRALALEPRDARAYLGRGWARVQLCQLNDAAADFAHAVQLDSTLASQAARPAAIAQQRAQCARLAAPSRAAARSCPPKNIVAFSLSARIVLENEWRKQHPGCP